jgi:pilus assembly protein CpaF
MFDKYRRNRLAATYQDVREEQAEESPVAASEQFDDPPLEVEISSPEAEGGQARRLVLAKILYLVHRQLLETLDLSALDHASEDEIRKEISDMVKDIAPNQPIALSRTERDRIIDQIYYEVTGYGPLEVLIKDDRISDILINGPEKVYIEQDGILQKTDVQFSDETHLRRILQKIVSAVGRRVDEMNPYVDARLPDGSRLNAMISPISVDGTMVSIRKFRKDSLSMQQLVVYGALSANMAEYLKAAVRCRLNIVISGGTGAGKTTLLNALSSYIGTRERVITVEDTAELNLQQDHVGRMESRPPNTDGRGEVTQRECLRNALRMRPDRIIVGETRGNEVIDMLQAMNTGHDGSMTTIHANSARDATSRLENMVALAGIEIPLSALRRQVASAVNLVVQISRMQDGSRRITSITEITGCENDVLSMQEIFAFEHTGISPDERVEGRFVSTGVRSHFTERFKRWGQELPATIYQSDPS